MRRVLKPPGHANHCAGAGLWQRADAAVAKSPVRIIFNNVVRVPSYRLPSPPSSFGTAAINPYTNYPRSNDPALGCQRIFSQSRAHAKEIPALTLSPSVPTK